MDFLLFESNFEAIKNKNICNHNFENLVCTKCGFLNSNKLINETQNINDNDILFENTKVFNINNNIGTNILSPYYNKINKWLSWGSSYREKQLIMMNNFIQEKCNNKIPKIIIDKTLSFLKFINEKKADNNLNNQYLIIRGINKQSVLATCVLSASFNTNFPLTETEIAKFFYLNNAQILKGSKLFQKIFENQGFDINNLAEKYIKRFTYDFSIENAIYLKALNILKNINLIEHIIINDQELLKAVSSLYIAFLIIKENTTKEIEIRKKFLNDFKLFFNKNSLNKNLKEIRRFKLILNNDILTKKWRQICKEIRRTMK